MYARYTKESIHCERLLSSNYQTLVNLLTADTKGKSSLNIDNMDTDKLLDRSSKRCTPYDSLPPFHFWRKAISSVQMGDVDPVVSTEFKINKNTRVATAGSCFAQHVSNALKKHGFNYYVTEQAQNLSQEEALKRNFGVFSARYGNIYTARQLAQIFDRAFDNFHPPSISPQTKSPLISMISS